jgi:hypothetical protein
VNISGKQKNSALYTEKLGNVFRQIASNPQILQVPSMRSLFNQIIESVGLSPLDFSDIGQMPQLQQSQQLTAPTGVQT